MLLGGLSACELHVQAATKVVAEAEKMKRDKKEAVVSAVAKAKDDRRAELRSGIDVYIHVSIISNNYFFIFKRFVICLYHLRFCLFLVTFWIHVECLYFLSGVPNAQFDSYPVI